MQAVIKDLTTQAESYKTAAQKYRDKGHHIPATKFEKLARNYRTAAKLLALIYPQK